MYGCIPLQYVLVYRSYLHSFRPLSHFWTSTYISFPHYLHVYLICVHCFRQFSYTFHLRISCFILRSMIAVLLRHVVILSHRLLNLPILLKFFSYFVSLALSFHLCSDRISVWQSWFQNTIYNFLTGRRTNIGKLKLFFKTSSKNVKYLTPDMI